MIFYYYIGYNNILKILQSKYQINYQLNNGTGNPEYTDEHVYKFVIYYNNIIIIYNYIYIYILYSTILYILQLLQACPAAITFNSSQQYFYNLNSVHVSLQYMSTILF